MIRLSVSQQDALRISEQLALLHLSPARRRRLLNQVGRQLIKQTRANLKGQHGPNGSVWEPRKQGRRKMLSKMAKGLEAKTNSEQTTVGWRNDLKSRIAYRHQHGGVETYTANRAKREHKRTSPDEPATKHQARLLRQLGYTIAAGKRGTRQRTPGMSWIQQNMTSGQAGEALRVLIAGKRDAKNASKQRWDITTTARPFLGATQQQVTDWIRTELQRTRG